MKWVSVKERLPDKHKKVLLWNGSSEALGTYDGTINDQGKNEFFAWPFFVTDITHWAELPEPPKEQ